MIIAVPYEEEYIYQHFGHSRQFKIYRADNNAIIDTKIVNTIGSGHGALAGFLLLYQTDVLICGGIGDGAIQALQNAEIKVYAGNSGLADEAVNKLLANELPQVCSSNCNHHDCGHENDGAGHQCGSCSSH